jgi:hypothetical protein
MHIKLFMSSCWFWTPPHKHNLSGSQQCQPGGSGISNGVNFLSLSLIKDSFTVRASLSRKQ